MKHNIPSNTRLAFTLYDLTVESYAAMVRDSHRRANPDHPKTNECRKVFEYAKMMFEVSTGIDWDSAFMILGEEPSSKAFMEYLYEEKDQ